LQGRPSRLMGLVVAAPRRLVGLDERQKCLATPQAARRPDLFSLVVLREGRSGRRQLNPWLLRRGEDVNVWREQVRVVECADADELDHGPCARVVAPDGDLAGWAPGNTLTCATLRWRIDNLRLNAQRGDSISFDQGVERERRAGLTLTPAAVAAMHHKRRRLYAVPDGATVAAALGRKRR